MLKEIKNKKAAGLAEMSIEDKEIWWLTTSILQRRI